MSNTTRPNAICKRRGGGPVIFVWLVASVALSVWSGCTATEKNYKVLTFFFDGVPDPNAPVQVSGGESESIVSAPVSLGGRGSIHKPYAENKCSDCHGGASRFEEFTKIPPTVCLNCHKDVPNAYPVMHGPVATIECNWCHSPHESPSASLLKFPSPDVCVQCHEQTLLPTTVPEHLEPGHDCLKCHVGHGSEKHGLLRPTIAIAVPTTMPTTTTAPTPGGAQ